MHDNDAEAITLHRTTRIEFEHKGTTIAVDRGKAETIISKRVAVGTGTNGATTILTIQNIHLPALAQALQGVLK